jgi:hypothetical protein
MPNDGKSRPWGRARENYPSLVLKAINDRLKAASPGTLPFEGEPLRTSADE